VFAPRQILVSTRHHAKTISFSSFSSCVEDSHMKRFVAEILSIVAFFAPVAGAQTPAPPLPVFRVNTELVQTDVMVFDESGRFVDGLRMEDFELRVDDQVKPVAFFEQIATGSAKEAATLTGTPAAARTAASSSGQGQTIFVYFDDLHLDLAGLNTAKNVITEFVQHQMSQNDRAAIVSASGQVGFLQQLTDNRSVLLRALDRVTFRSDGVRDNERPIMSEYHATLIDRYDRDIFEFFVEETLKLNPLITREGAEAQVRMRVRAILQQGAQRATHTLDGLERMIQSSSSVPGRKLVFFISGGFLIDHRNSNLGSKFKDVSSAAAESGAVIYSIDARGLVGNMTGAGVDVPFDNSGRLLRASLDELSATQDGLNALASDTGGRPIMNTNAIAEGVTRALRDTSAYYLLAWAPDKSTQPAKLPVSLNVRVIGRPNLTVRVRRGFVDTRPTAVAPFDAQQEKVAAEQQLRNALTSAHPEREMDVSLSTNFVLTTDKKIMLVTSMHVPRQSLSFNSTADGKQEATLRVAGLVLNDRGQSGATFGDGIAIQRSEADASEAQRSVTYRHQIVVEPGLYQVRVAVRDEEGGRTGSAHSWIEIPDVASGRFELSSLLIGTSRQTETDEPPDNGSITNNMIVHSRFRQGATLRFFVFAYNAARSATDSRADLAARVLVLRDDRVVITTPFKLLKADESEYGHPYAGDLLLAGLQSGRYMLQVEVIDRVSKSRVVRHSRFDIEQQVVAGP
jgi:VWFA-related protein